VAATNAQRRLERQLADDETSLLSQVRAYCKEGSERKGHGLVLTLTAHPSHSCFYGSGLNLSVDVHGSSVFSALPSGLGLLASSMLPQEVTATVRKVTGKEVTLEIGVGLKQLSRGRVDQVLQSVIDSGDEPFVFEFRDANTHSLVGFVPTTASKVKASLETGSNLYYTDHISPPLKPKGKKFQYVKLLKCMLLFAVAIWVLYLYPQAVLTTVPSAMLKQSYNASTVADVLPLHPTNMTAAFQMGELRERLYQEHLAAETFDRPVDELAVELILQQAAALGGKSNAESVTEEQLRNSLDEIIRIENQVSLISRVRGFFSFINCIWLFSIIGICISIGPTLYLLLHPLRAFIVRVSKYIAYEIIIPFLVRMHSWGIIELLVFGLCFIAVVEGYRIGNDVGVMLALTGHILSVPCVFYSAFLWGKRIAAKWRNIEMMQILQTWIMITWIPSAIYFQSSLMGYGVVMVLFWMLGMDARVYPLLIMVGFESEADALRCTVASFVLIVLQTVSRLIMVNSHFVAPFTSATGVIGNNIFFLSMLILSFSSRYHANVFSIMLTISLVVFNLLGHVLEIPGMSTVAITYTVLSSMMKYSEFHIKYQFNIWALVLIMSLLIWRISLFLHLNPEYITCLVGF
jgi:hypothetical protein